MDFIPEPAPTTVTFHPAPVLTKVLDFLEYSYLSGVKLWSNVLLSVWMSIGDCLGPFAKGKFSPHVDGPEQNNDTQILVRFSCNNFYAKVRFSTLKAATFRN